MTVDANLRKPPHERLVFLAETVMAESSLLSITDGRLFASPMDRVRAGTLRDDVELAERVDAFVAHFGRLQDISATPGRTGAVGRWSRRRAGRRLRA